MADLLHYVKLGDDEIGQLFEITDAPKGSCRYKFLHPNGDMIAANEPAMITKEARRRYIANYPNFQPAPEKGAQR